MNDYNSFWQTDLTQFFNTISGREGCWDDTLTFKSHCGVKVVCYGFVFLKANTFCHQQNDHGLQQDYGYPSERKACMTIFHSKGVIKTLHMKMN